MLLPRSGESAQDARALFEQAQASERAGDLTAAERLYRQVTQRDPASAEAHANLGVVLASQQKFAAAIEHYRRALRIKPALDPLRINLGLALLKSGQARQAARELGQYIDAHPDDRRARQLLANALLESDQYEQAARHYQELLPSDDLSIRLGLGAAYTRLGRRAEAERLFSEVAMAENSAAVQLAIGQAYLAVNDLASAEEALKRAAALDPKLPGLHFALGSARWKRQQSAEAIAEWQQELKTDPGNFEASFALGAALAESNESDTAEPHLKKARALRPAHGPTLYYLAKIAWKRRSPEAAILLKESVKLDPSNRPAHYLLAQIYKAQGNTQAAARELAVVQDLARKQVQDDIDILENIKR